MRSSASAADGNIPGGFGSHLIKTIGGPTDEIGLMTEINREMAAQSKDEV
jgi:hypothetical protein